MIPKQLFLIWFHDERNIPKQKQIKIDNIIKKVGDKIKVILITYDNMNQFILKEHPIHPLFKNLSFVHQSDYFRSYLMCFHGGGYMDIKRMGGDVNSWLRCYELFDKNKDLMICGTKEISHSYNCVANANEYSKIISGFNDIDGIIHTHSKPDNISKPHLYDAGYKFMLCCGNYLCRKQTGFIVDWYNSVYNLMDNNYNELKNNPPNWKEWNDKRRNIEIEEIEKKGAGFGICRTSREKQPSYPFYWADVLGRIYQPLLYKWGKINSNYINNTLPGVAH